MNRSEKITHATALNRKSLAILVDPDKFNRDEVLSFLNRIPKETTHLFVGGSTVEMDATQKTILALKEYTRLPIYIFPGDYSQVSENADAVLFLSLLSGRNPEYLIGQQVKAAAILSKMDVEAIPTAYLLIDGGNISAVSRVSETQPMPQDNVDAIVNTALAGQYMGAKLVYLEAGSGAKVSVHTAIISAVKRAIQIPLVVGGGIKTKEQMKEAYEAGADMLVMGTAFEK